MRYSAVIRSTRLVQNDMAEAPRNLGSLVSAQTVAFTARTWMSGYEDNGEPKRSLMPGQAFKVLARRPGSLSIREDRDDPVMRQAIERAECCIGTPFSVFISNGVRQL